MATYDNVGIAPAAATPATLLTASADTIVSTISVCNRSSSAGATYRIAVRPNGDALVDSHYLVYDAPLATNESVFLTLGIALAATDLLVVQASTANVTFRASLVVSP